MNIDKFLEQVASDLKSQSDLNGRLTTSVIRTNGLLDKNIKAQKDLTKAIDNLGNKSSSSNNVPNKITTDILNDINNNISAYGSILANNSKEILISQNKLFSLMKKPSKNSLGVRERFDPLSAGKEQREEASFLQEKRSNELLEDILKALQVGDLKGKITGNKPTSFLENVLSSSLGTFLGPFAAKGLMSVLGSVPMVAAITTAIAATWQGYKALTTGESDLNNALEKLTQALTGKKLEDHIWELSENIKGWSSDLKVSLGDLLGTFGDGPKQPKYTGNINDLTKKYSSQEIESYRKQSLGISKASYEMNVPVEDLTKIMGAENFDPKLDPLAVAKMYKEHINSLRKEGFLGTAENAFVLKELGERKGLEFLKSLRESKDGDNKELQEQYNNYIKATNKFNGIIGAASGKVDAIEGAISTLTNNTPEGVKWQHSTNSMDSLLTDVLNKTNPVKSMITPNKEFQELFKRYSPDVSEASNKYGVPEDFMKTMMFIESRGKTDAENKSGAKGLYQFVPSTAKAYGIDGKEFDPKANIDAAARLARDNAKQLRDRGIEANDFNLYMAHQQGVGGYSSILKGKITPQLQENMEANSGIKGITTEQFLNFWRKQYQEKKSMAGTFTPIKQQTPLLANTMPLQPLPEPARTVQLASAKAEDKSTNTKAAQTPVVIGKMGGDTNTTIITSGLSGQFPYSVANSMKYNFGVI